MRKFINFIVFQVGWFACILGAAQQKLWFGLAVALICLGVQLWRSRAPQSDLHLIMKGVVLGIVLDTLLLQFSLIEFKSNSFPHISPIWMWLLWALLMTTLNESMSWLKHKLVFASILGAIFGPLSYVAGVTLGAATWGHPYLAFLLLSIAWALSTPLLFYWSRQSNY